MSKILFFSRDPGGANTLLPLIRVLLHQKKHSLEVFGKEYACTKYTEEKILYRDIRKDFPGKLTYEAIKAFLTMHRPDVIVTGTSEDDMTEKYLWRAAAILRIPSVAILDYWTNYTLRFSRNISGLSKLTKRVVWYLPDRICVMDKVAYNDMLAEGFPKSKLFVTGNPYLDSYLTTHALTSSRKRILRSRFGFKKSTVLITFVSEPLVTLYSNKAERVLGYDEKSIFEHVFNAVRSCVADRPDQDIVLIVRPHPKDKRGIWETRLAHRQSAFQIIQDRTIASWEMAQLSDVVIGMSSMFLLETTLLGVPVMSVQIGLKKEDPCILNRIGKNSPVLSYEDLVVRLKSLLSGRGDPQCLYHVRKGATQRILKIIDSLAKGGLCHN